MRPMAPISQARAHGHAVQCSAGSVGPRRYKKTTAGKWNHRYFMLNDAKLLHYFPMSQYGHLDAVDTPKGTIALDGTVIQQHVRSRAQSVRPVGPSPFAMCSVPCDVRSRWVTAPCARATSMRHRVPLLVLTAWQCSGTESACACLLSSSAPRRIGFYLDRNPPLRVERDPHQRAQRRAVRAVHSRRHQGRA